MLHGKDFALHHHAPGIHGNGIHRNRIALDGLAIQQIGIGCRSYLCLGCRLFDLRHMGNRALADFFRCLKQLLRIQLFSHLNINFHSGIKHILEPALCTGDMRSEHLLAVALQLEHHRLPLQPILAACQYRHTGRKQLLEKIANILRLQQ